MEHAIVTKDLLLLTLENERKEREFEEFLERKKEWDVEYEKLIYKAKEMNEYTRNKIKELLKDMPEDVRKSILDSID